jgi:integral membrane protein
MSTTRHTWIARLRFVGFWEGWSYLLLLGIAMPLKYWAGMPGFVRVVGMAHGLLFVAYVAALGITARSAGFTLGRTAVLFVASLLPFGPFLADRGLARDLESEGAG